MAKSWTYCAADRIESSRAPFLNSTRRGQNGPHSASASFLANEAGVHDGLNQRFRNCPDRRWDRSRVSDFNRRSRSSLFANERRTGTVLLAATGCQRSSRTQGIRRRAQSHLCVGSAQGNASQGRFFETGGERLRAIVHLSSFTDTLLIVSVDDDLTKPWSR